MSEEYRNALPPGTVIDTYQIEKILGVGGFGITYLVRDLNLGKAYAIKELLPDGIAIRQGGETTVMARSNSDQDNFDATRKYFISEARVLAGMDHPAVVSVHRLMEANGTCYMVMDYVQGDTLGDYLKKQGGTFRSKAEFEQVFYPLMAGLEVLHGQNIIHRDIKPGNIMVRPDGSPVLLDFGAATQVQSKTVTITQMLSAGYSPFEQYTSRAKQGPYTDIYALSATMLKCITGKKPDDASDRVYGDRYQSLTENKAHLATYGTSFLSAVDAALQMDAKLRPQTVSEWRKMMEHEREEAEVVDADISAQNIVSESTPPSHQNVRPLAVRIGDPKQIEAGHRSFLSQTKRDLAFLMWLMERKWGVNNPKAALRALAIGGAILLVFGLIMSSVLGGGERRDQNSAKENAAELARAKELARQKGIARTKEVVRQEQLERDRELERQKEIARVKEVERQKKLELEKQRKIASVVGETAAERKLFTLGGQQVAFRWCPPTGEGGFMMGSPTDEKDRGDDEQQHKVVLTKGFWLMGTEVTQGLWRAVIDENPSSFKKGDDYPVEQVSWEDCDNFIKKLNASGKLPQGLKAALPTEAQWEYACRAGSRGAYAGDLLIMGWYEINSGNTTHAVRQKKPNEWGMYDMHGNVWEWCADWNDKDYYSAVAAGRDPKGPGANGQNRVLRGGGWVSYARSCRSANRDGGRPGNRGIINGFRLSLQIEAR